jgi:MFS superfamily sulfate permease-like transporter
MKNYKKILIVLAIILVISSVISGIAYMVIKNSAPTYLDYMPPVEEGKMSIEMYRVQKVLPFVLFDLIFSIASVVVLFMTKVLGKKALDIILAIFIVIIPIIVLFLSTNTLLIEKVVAVY